MEVIVQSTIPQETLEKIFSDNGIILTKNENENYSVQVVAAKDLEEATEMVLRIFDKVKISSYIVD